MQSRLSDGRKFWLVFALLMCLLAAGAFAQTNEGSIVGNILDPTSATVPNATITATGRETGSVYHALSTSSGSFNIPNVRIGTYDVSVTAPGFQTNQVQGIIVQVATQSTLKVTLQPGNVSQTVTVNAEAPTIQSESSDIGAVVTSKQVLDLPLALGSSVQAMRSPEAFVFLVPGTVGPGTNGSSQTSGASEGGPFESKVSGGQNFGTEVLLDGASTYRSENGSSFDEAAPSVEALTEFRVETSTMPAEYGRTTGGIEIFSTRSGTNDFHGDAYDLLRNKDLDANTWFNNYQGLPRILDTQNDYGGVLAGPVWIPHLYNGKNRTFFMFSWEQYRQTVGFSSTSTVPTAAERGGDFTADLNMGQIVGTNPCDGTPVYFGEIYDPATTRTGAGGVLCRTSYLAETGKNAIPTAQQSPIAQKLLSFYPAPTNNNAINNLTFNGSYPLLDTTMTIRIDQNISDKHKLFAMYDSRDNNRLSNSPTWGNAASPGGPSQDFFTHFGRAGEDWTISPTMLNHLNLGFNHTNSANYAAGVRLGHGTNWDAALGITNVSGTTFPAINTGQPNISTLGDTNFGDTIDYGYRLNDTFDWVKSKHTVKFGVDYRYQIFEPGTFSNTTGSFNFACGETAAAAGPLAASTCAASGNGIASLLLGQVDNATAAAYAIQPQWRSHYYALFAQDSFKVTPSFTLNYGLRWEVDAPRYEVHGDTSDISLTAPNPGAGGRPGALVFAGKGPGRNGIVDETWANTWHKDFAPRIGFAWAPAQFNNKLAIRGGYAIYYGALTYADFGADLQDGFTALPSFSSPNSGFSPAFNIASGFPSYPAPPSLDPTLANFAGNPTNAYVDPSYGRPAMVNNWSLDVQSQLATDLILDVGYVGQHSTHLRSNIDPINNLNPAYFHLGTTLTESISTAGVPAPFPGFGADRQVAESLLPYPQFFALNTDCCLENLGQSSYDALEVSLQRRFHAGLNLMASYTWSKTLTDADSTLPFFANLAGGGAIQNPFDLRDEKSVSNQDIPQNFVLSYIYELPFGRNKKWLNKGGITNIIFGGWSVSGVQTYHSGQPEAFCCATGIPWFDGAIRYNYVPGQPFFSQAFLSGNYNPATTPIFNKAAFEDPNSAANVALLGYRLGDMSRTDPSARSFFYKSEDFNVLKRTHLTERVDILFQMSFLDAFNRHIFDNHVSVDLNPTDAKFGVMNPNSLIMGPRRIQLQMKLEF